MKRASCILLAILVSTFAQATDWEPKTDNEIAALDLKTGMLLWAYKPDKLGNAHFEVHQQGLVVYPHYAGNKKTDPLFLDLNKGTPITPFRTDLTPLAKSATFWPGLEIKLTNGWVLQGFSAGNTMSLTFVDPQTKTTVWSIETGGYPHQVACWNDYVFYSFSYLSDEGVLYAYRAGRETPSWTLDLNQIVTDREVPLTRMIFQIMGDVLYLEANEHIFGIDPETGKLRWHRDLAKDLNVPFERGFYGGGLNLAVFAKSGNTLVVSFEKRVVALDLTSMRCLWHLEPDTFPGCPFPAVHDGMVFLSSGKNRQLFKMHENKKASNKQDARDGF
jgi:outer membrane protein assembly factor BamB